MAVIIQLNDAQVLRIVGESTFWHPDVMQRSYVTDSRFQELTGYQLRRISFTKDINGPLVIDYEITAEDENAALLFKMKWL